MKNMPYQILAADTFDVGAQMDTIVTTITTNMQTVAEKAIGLVGSAAPLIIGVVAVGIILAFGVKLIKKVKN